MKKQILNEEFLKMQKLAGLITEGQYKANLNEMSEETLVSTLEENGFEVVPNPAWIVRNSETGDDYILYTESGDYISHKLVGTFPEGVKIMGEGADEWLEQFLETEKKNELNENTMDVMAVLNRNGIDEDYFESMGGKEVESGTEEWLDVLSDITGKDAYEGEFTPEDDKLIQKFISDMEDLGIELI